jgi:hypothetical protein
MRAISNLRISYTFQYPLHLIPARVSLNHSADLGQGDRLEERNEHISRYRPPSVSAGGTSRGRSGLTASVVHFRPQVANPGSNINIHSDWIQKMFSILFNCPSKFQNRLLRLECRLEDAESKKEIGLGRHITLW